MFKWGTNERLGGHKFAAEGIRGYYPIYTIYVCMHMEETSQLLGEKDSTPKPKKLQLKEAEARFTPVFYYTLLLQQQLVRIVSWVWIHFICR